MNKWAYYDKRTNQTVEVAQWQDKSANIDGDWVRMTKYFRIHVRFLNPVTYSGYDKAARKAATMSTEQAILVITATAHEKLMEQTKGRGDEAWYRFIYKTVNQKNRTYSYVDNIEWVDPVNLPANLPPPLPKPDAPAKSTMDEILDAPAQNTSSEPPADLAPTPTETNSPAAPAQTPDPTINPPLPKF